MHLEYDEVDEAQDAFKRHLGYLPDGRLPDLENVRTTNRLDRDNMDYKRPKKPGRTCLLPSTLCQCIAQSLYICTNDSHAILQVRKTVLTTMTFGHQPQNTSRRNRKKFR